MEKKLSICFNHYRGEGGSAKEISTDYEVEATEEEVPSEDRRSFFKYITIVGHRSNVISFMEDYNMMEIIDESNLIESNDDIESYYDDGGDDAML